MKLKEIFQRVIQRLPIYLVQFKTLVKKEGVFFTFKRATKKIFRFLHSRGRVGDLNRILFKEWMSNVESVYLNQKSMKEDLSKLKVKPKFSIIFPVWNKSEEMLQSALDSITDQIYDNWEICISDGSSKGVKESKEFLEGFKKEYPKRVKLSFLSEELRDGINIIQNSNNAINMATGQYLVFMDCDDEISPNCLLELAKGINNNPKVDFLYSDFDKIDQRGNRFDPSFWPDWSPHTLTSQMYTTHVTCYKKRYLKS
ncbi:glycosyltransferase [Candidatus Dojkabacteria bacterium]|uniref:Glycosyltransferase n=1 Tax=Candidatus Dojkabacteria bacterium TaxID=2099670 RepID=A0A847ET73_9BACT|nr:glycosyltransferase [Candidatus Dojkabacteria bacterium]